jgi:hypothetical protein
MSDYDVALKSILTRREGSVLTRLTGTGIVRWINPDLPEIRSLEADLLGETKRRTLLHVELQSTNDGRMTPRMLEYAVAIQRNFGRFPEQLVLYVGQEPLRMNGRIREGGVAFECSVMDIRELDSEALLASGSLEDNVLAILGHLSGSGEVPTIRRILKRIAGGDPARRPGALSELTILARLRDLVPILQRETERMPI